VRSVSLTFATDNWLGLLGCAGGGGPGGGSSSRTDVPATLEVDGVRLERVGVHCKGNSSLSISGTKKPLNITTDAFVPGQQLWGMDVINLDNGWSDPSQLRAAIALRLLREYTPAQRFSFARVTVQGQYIGLYTMSEQVNGEFDQHWYPGDDGFNVKGDSPARIAFNSSTLQFLGESVATYKQQYEVKGRAASSDDGYVRLRELTRALDAATTSGGLAPADFPEGIRQQLDIETALWYLATSNLIANFDSYYVGKNYFMYVGGRDPRFHLVPWDLGLSFGVFGLQGGGGGGRPGPGTSSAQVSPFAQESDQNRPLIRRLLAVPDYRADYLAHYRALLSEAFTTEWIGAVGTRYQLLIQDAVKAEEAAQGRVAGAFTYAQFLANLQSAVGSGGGGPGGGPGGSAPGILALVADRRAYLATVGDLASPEVHLESQAHEPAAPTLSDAVAVRATFSGADTIASVQLRYRVDGGFENQLAMTADNGGWRATIPAQRAGSVVSYVLRVGLDGGAAAFFPTATLTKPFTYTVAGVTLPRLDGGDLAINELMADNKATLADEAGEYDDWVELVNRGPAAIDLEGYYLSDKADDPWQFALPAGQLAPGGRLLVWCDNDPEQGPLHADFGLSKNGETVLLSTRTATVDSVTFSALRPDESAMRLPDATGEWFVCTKATPNQANACEPGGIVTPGAPTATEPVPSATTPRPATSTPSRTPTRPAPTARPSVTPTPTHTNGPKYRVFLPWAWRR
jgi:hypothetical protein